MTKPRNPFTCGGPVPPSHFIGREREIGMVLDQLASHAQGSVAISGERRIGKTSLLNYVAEPEIVQEWGLTPERNLFVFLDCQSISRFTPTRFWQRVLKLLSPQIGEDPLKGAIKQLLGRDEISSADLESILDELYHRGQMLTLLLDEFEWVIRTDPQSEATTCDFLSGLRALINRMPRVFSAVVATRKPLDGLCRPIRFMGSPFYNNFVFVRLKPFTDQEVNELIERALENAGITFAEEERSYIRQIAGTHPLLIQIASWLIFEARSSGLDEVENYSPIGIRFEEQARHHFTDLWEWSSEREQTLLMLLALRKLGGRLADRSYDIGDLGKVLGRYERDLRYLAERGLVVDIENDPTIFSSVFEWWVAQEMITKSNKEELAKREWLYGELVTREELDQIKRVMKAVIEKTDIVKRLADWAVEAVTRGAVKGMVS